MRRLEGSGPLALGIGRELAWRGLCVCGTQGWQGC
jgi:hypothetical protein